MKPFLRVLCLLFALLLLLSACDSGAFTENTTTRRNETSDSDTSTKEDENTNMNTDTTSTAPDVPVTVQNPISLTDLSVVRPQSGSSMIVYAASTVSRTVGEKADNGVVPPVRTDLHQQTTPEILIGETNRTESAEAKALLGKDLYAFVIRRKGNKLAVVGTTDEMTCYGVEYMIREIVPAVVSDTAIGLAEDYCYMETGSTLSLVANGRTDFRVSVSSDAMNSALYTASQTVCKAFKPVTGANAAYFEDSGDQTAQRDAATKEILIGSTYHPETYHVFSHLTYQEGAVAIEGNKIVIYGFSDEALTSATELFCNLVSSCTSGKNVVLPDKLFLRVSGSSANVSAPIYPAAMQKLVPVDGDGVMVYVPGTGEADFAAYAAALESKGYVRSAENQLGFSSFYTYTKGRNVIYGGYDPKDKVARIILEASGAKTPIVEEAFDAEEDTICSPLLTQVDLNNLDCQSGMSYVIRLRDGRFIVIDGGATDYDEAKQLYNLLKQQHVGGGKPTIAAWFLTHSHGDHWQAFLEMAQTYADNLTIQSVIINLGTQDLFAVEFDTASKSTIYSKVRGISGAKIIYARTGQQFRFANATIDVWLTPEDLYEGTPKVNRGNDASVIYRLSCEGQTTMFLADAEQGIADVMVRRYGVALKSDIMQISHHGYSYSDRMPPLFRCVDPKVVLWPSVDHWYHYFLDYSNNKELVASAQEIVPACHGTRVLTLPYEAQPAAEYFYNDGDVIYSEDFESVRNLYEIGWQMSDNLDSKNYYTTPNLTLSTVDGDRGLKMTGKAEGANCSTLSFLCRDHLKNVTTYTVEMDLKVSSLGDGFSIWYHDSEPMNNGGEAIYQVSQTGKFTLKLVIERKAGGTTKAYIDGALVGTYVNASNELGPLIFKLQRSQVFVGRVEVTAGAN